MANEQKKEVIYSLYIIGKSGSLLYQRDFDRSQRRISSNDHLFLASTFHALHAIAATGIVSSKNERNLSPAEIVNGVVPSTELNEDGPATPHKLPLAPLAGITSLEAENFRLHCLQTLTGNKFVLITSPGFATADAVLKRISLLFCDFALKNPFYELGMPVRW